MYIVDNMVIQILVGIFILSQGLYAITFLVDLYFFSLPINRVDLARPPSVPVEKYPFIVLFYPVLRELETTMRTTFVSLGQLNYPRDRFKVVAIPNKSDAETIASLQHLQVDFPFVEILAVPPTSDSSWDVVWNAWDSNSKVYWWHRGPRAGVRDLPPKKTRQLIYAFYTMAQRLQHEPDLAINYIDADSAPPPNHLLAAVNGLQEFDVLQATNVAGNLNSSLASSWHAFDHMAWDGHKYRRLTANGRQPYWVLGKGLFFKASDLLQLGGFHPWITIEDPEVGMRFWKNGKRLGIIEEPLIEEVPETLREGVNQRKRWVCGFFQSLSYPLTEMEFTAWERMKARLVFLPCLSLWVNSIGIPTGIWALTAYLMRRHYVPEWTIWFAVFNLTSFAISLSYLYASTWRRTALVLSSYSSRLKYMFRINPIFIMAWWIIWIIPLAIGLRMYIRDEGLVWQRTEKIDANNILVRNVIAQQTGKGA